MTDRRTKVDWAEQVEDYPDKEDKDRIVLVNNLNTHSDHYTTFEPMEARRIAERLEIHGMGVGWTWL